MTTPNCGIPYVPEGTLDPAAGLNASLDVADALIQTAVESMLLTAPPGSPTDGEAYIPAAPATGAWTGLEDYLVRYRTEGAFWQSYAPGTQVRLVLNNDDGIIYRWASEESSPGWVPASGGGGAADQADIGLFFPGGPPLTNQLVAKYIAARTMTFPADFAGAVGHVGTNPTGSFVMTVSVGGASAGTITVSTGGVFTFVTTGSAPVAVVSGDEIEIEAPAGTDATVADIAVTLVAGL
jgi:hypothetical protein